MANMKYTLLLALFCAAGLCSAAPSAKAPATAQSIESVLNAALQDMVKKNSEDFYDAAACVYDNGGNVMSFAALMTAAADKGNPAAQLWQSRYLKMFADTDPTVVDKAVKLLEKAAATGYVPAMVEYAGLVYSRSGADSEQKKALNVLMQACRKGSPKARALYLMVSGRMQSSGLSSPEIVSELKKKNYYLEEMIAAAQSDETSFSIWMERASEHGSAFAAFTLCQFADPVKADEYLKLAVDRHLPAALGHMGLGIVRREAARMEQYDAKVAAEGLRMLNLSAMLCTPAALSSLASLYAEGYGENVSRELICELFRLSHRCGDPNGTAGLGYCMVLGAGCKQDSAAGLVLMESARDKGAQWVNQALASMYFNGDGVPADMNKAISALTDDYVSGSHHAYAIMAAITALGNDSAKADERRARLYLQMAVSNGDSQAPDFYDMIVKEGKWRFLEELTK